MTLGRGPVRRLHLPSIRAAALVALASLSACTGGERSSAEPTEIGSLPSQWVAARRIHGGFALVAVNSRTGRERTLARVRARGDRGSAEQTVAFDVAVDASLRTVLVTFCCETSSGRIARVAAGRVVDADQGHRIDLSSSGKVLVRTDTFGTLRIWPTFPAAAGRIVRAGSGAVDVASAGDGALVAVLVDPARVKAFAPTAPTPRRRGVLVLERHVDSWRQRFVSTERRYCGIVVLAGSRIGLLRSSFDPTRPLSCAGRSLDVLDPSTLTLVEGAVEFPGVVRRLGSDGAGRNLIYVMRNGDVAWRTLAGEGGRLTSSGGLLAADW